MSSRMEHTMHSRKLSSKEQYHSSKLNSTEELFTARSGGLKMELKDKPNYQDGLDLEVV